MPLQNRVDPFGAIHAAPGRGLFTGNRGVIHDPETRTLLKRRWTTRAWIICTLDHPRGVKREPMGRNAPSGGAGWTELFFLDEATALAAGHRPCFYCRRAAAEAFRRCFAEGNRLDDASAPAIDAILHRQRLAPSPGALSAEEIEDLPDGAMVAASGRVLALHRGRAFAWRFSGYGAAEKLPPAARLITPPATVAALRAGFTPVWHPSLT